MSHPHIVVLACGNVSRGDDALGPLLLRQIEALGLGHVTVLEDYQLNIEHALDLEAADLALFVDAGAGTPAPFTFREIAPAHGMSHSTHALEPDAVLSTFVRVVGRPPPPSFVLSVRGEAFELGASLSPAARANLERASDFAARLLPEPRLADWKHLARAPTAEV